ncbi:MAG TPA: transcription antitermination factor NusB [Mycobacteriales bacterium]|nr:transcription antitermination factor NusB [Mycobacteriales bacterium]
MPARSRVDAPRLVAAEVVGAVETEAAYANLLLPRLLRERSITGRDAAFATELTYGSLRWQGVLDEVISAASNRDVATLDPPVRTALRLGAYQLLHMRTPAHAAVHATVELARATSGPRPVGLVNAVLRKVGAADWPTWVQRLAPSDDIGRLAFTHGYPRWIASAFDDALHGDRAELAAALAEDRPVTHLVARPGRVDRAELLREVGDDAAPGPWSPYAVRLGGGDPAALAAVRSGAAAVQDEGSQLAALAAARADLADADGGAWLDMCAGPGGKAALLAGLLPAGGRLTCAELRLHRARLVAGALDASARVVVADGGCPAWPDASFDRVLVDAPCTGLGALRRRPEVRWRRRPEDVGRLQELQVQLLLSALRSARPGGVVAYVTCSPHPQETRAVVDRAVAAVSGVRRLDTPAVIGVPDVGPGPDAQLWPHRHGTDAMYVSLLMPEHRS